MKSLLILLTLLVSHSAFSNQKGNGGDVVICPDENGGKSVELLDFHEARIQRKIVPTRIEQIRLGSEDAKNFLLRLGQKLRKFDHKAFSEFDNDALNLLSSFRDPSSDPEIVFTSEDLTNISDSEEVLRGKGCESKQIVNQMIRRFPGDPRFFVQKELFDQISDRDRIGLIVHESIYRAFIRVYGVQNSYVVRYLTALVSAKDTDEITFPEYIRAIRSLGPVLISVDGFEFNLEDLRISAEGHILARTDAGTVVVIDDGGAFNHGLTEEFGGVLIRKLPGNIKVSRVLAWESDVETLLPFGDVSLKLTTPGSVKVWTFLRMKGIISLTLTESRSVADLRIRMNGSSAGTCERTDGNGDISSCIDGISML